ncbi:MAG: lysine 2,3-aminomutase [Acidobacteriota bacterium]
MEPPSRRHTPWADVPEEQWADWRWQLRHSLRTADEVSEFLRCSEGQREEIRRLSANFRFAITPYYASLIDLDDRDDPVALQVLPQSMELVNAGEESEDHIGEEHYSPVKRIVHRYPDRVLFLLTEQCSVYCRFCTRRRIVGGGMEKGYLEEIQEAIQYVRETPEVRDVLISGGDPLIYAEDKLEPVLAALREIEHVEIIRLGTRVPVVLPMRVTDALCGMLRKYHPLYINTHFNHPREITTYSAAACGRLADAGIPLGNQSVLMRGVNDCPVLMKRLVHSLLKIRVRPYYLYQADLAPGTKHFRAPISKGIEIVEALRGHTTGFAVPTFAVDMVAGGGKVPLAPNYVVTQAPGRWVLRNYEGFMSMYVEPDDYEDRCPDRCGEDHGHANGETIAGLVRSRTPFMKAKGRAVARPRVRQKIAKIARRA